MRVTQVEFLTSARDPAGYPRPSLPEVAMAGRSNVGKSSLINALLGRRQVARVSRTPGKTRLINFFKVDDRFVLVDLPGYGYARVSRAEREAWRPMVEAYLTSREVLRGVVAILDCRHLPTEADRSLLDWLGAVRIPTVVALTKSDKLSVNERRRQSLAIAQALGRAPETLVLFSAVTGDGREPLWRRVQTLLAAPPPNSSRPTDQLPK
ncbi:MAG: YihA family ribosome biogenesis GTP-binding protein [Deltaproteobacteria bacterium]|nr:YihA family ribosome biogenesis GTP-binding protein [Deltaproteobacteria bacterium]